MPTSAGKYKTQLFDTTQETWLPSSPGIGMHVEVWLIVLYNDSLIYS